jgi:Holliday junction resolvase RusA-like endonuclease
MIVQIEVLGAPAPKGSSRPMFNKQTGKAFSFAGGSKVTEQKLGRWDQDVREAARRAVGECIAPPFVDAPLSVLLVFRLVRPAGHWGKGKRAGQLIPSAPLYPRTKPDIDKLARSTLDSLIGIVFDDDSRIARLTVAKDYATPGNEGALDHRRRAAEQTHRLARRHCDRGSPRRGVPRGTRTRSHTMKRIAITPIDEFDLARGNVVSFEASNPARVVHARVRYAEKSASAAA